MKIVSLLWLSLAAVACYLNFFVKSFHGIPVVSTGNISSLSLSVPLSLCLSLSLFFALEQIEHGCRMVQSDLKKNMAC